MPQAALSNMLYAMLTDAAIFVVPPLVVATIVAFIVGLFQAVTQIQEQTLPQTIKIFVISLILIFFGTMLASPLYSLTDQIFTEFPIYQQ